MFKNMILYQLGPGWPHSAQELEQSLQNEPFTPCTATQAKSSGWTPPRGEKHGALVEVAAGQWLAQFTIETKSVPASAVKKKVQEMADKIEREHGRKPGRKELRDMKYDALTLLLPNAFPRQKACMVWIDPETRIMAVDASSQAVADEVVASLVRVSGPYFSISQVITKVSPQAAMTQWLLAACDGESLPDGLHIRRDCELRSAGDEPARVRFDSHPVTTPEIRKHITEGKRPVKLALGWQGTIYFTLTNTMQLKRIVIEQLQNNVPSDSAKDELEKFAADAAIFTGEMRQMLPELLAAMGGVSEVGGVGGVAQ